VIHAAGPNPTWDIDAYCLRRPIRVLPRGSHRRPGRCLWSGEDKILLRRPTTVHFGREKSRNLQGKSTRFEDGNRLILGYKRAPEKASTKRCWANDA
jgi:hypothetical protein